MSQTPLQQTPRGTQSSPETPRELPKASQRASQSLPESFPGHPKLAQDPLGCRFSKNKNCRARFAPKDQVWKVFWLKLASCGSSRAEIGYFHNNSPTRICWNRSRDLKTTYLSRSLNLNLARVGISVSQAKLVEPGLLTRPGLENLLGQTGLTWLISG